MVYDLEAYLFESLCQIWLIELFMFNNIESSVMKWKKSLPIETWSNMCHYNDF